MRSYKVYGIADGGAETYVTTVYSAAEGKAAHVALIKQAHFDTMIVRNALGGHVMRKELKKEVDPA